jgi:hypothetical protein
MKLTISDRTRFPKCLQPFSEVKQIHVGGCIDENAIITYGMKGAHAHDDKRDTYHGTICLGHRRLWRCDLLLLHEAAHILTAKRYGRQTKNGGHTDKWREIVVEIGGTYNAFVFTHGGKSYENFDYNPRQDSFAANKAFISYHH